MDPARGTPRTGATRGRTTILGLASTLVGACAAVVVLATPALAAPSSTTVNPAGDGFTATLATGASADFTVQSTTVSCNQSSTSGQVPLAPGNHNDAGPVSIPLSPPTFENSPQPCTTNVFDTTATNEVSPSGWSVAIQFDPNGSTATLTIPQRGVVTTTSGLANCTITVAPNGPDPITAQLNAGDGATQLPRMVFADTAIHISVTGGFGCPTAQTSALFNATYEITDTTNPDLQFTVTA